MPTFPVTERVYICPIVEIDPTHRVQKLALIVDPGVIKDPGPPKVCSCISLTSIISNAGPGKCLCRAWANDWSNVDADPECVRLMPSVDDPDYTLRLDQALTAQQITDLATALNTAVGIDAGQVTGAKKIEDILALTAKAVWPQWWGRIKDFTNGRVRSIVVKEAQIEP